MNRTDRLLAIVLELQARGARRAEDLAATFETSKRTIYRDIGALSEAGVPVVATPGRGYSLIPGYFLPPLSFTPDEAVMLLLGAEFVAANFDPQGSGVARAAARKIEGVLPDAAREEVRSLRRGLRFVATGVPLAAPVAALGAETLRLLRGAIVEGRTVRFRYHTRHRAEDGPVAEGRTADPYGLVHLDRAWYLVAHDHERRALRHFRLDRIEDLAVLPERFARPPDFDLGQHGSGDGRPLVARVLFDPAVARWVRESRFFYVVAEEEGPDGLLVTLRARRESELLPWLLGWGGTARVLAPESLRGRLAAEAEAVLRHYREVAPASPELLT